MFSVLPHHRHGYLFETPRHKRFGIYPIAEQPDLEAAETPKQQLKPANIQIHLFDPKGKEREVEYYWSDDIFDSEWEFGSDDDSESDLDFDTDSEYDDCSDDSDDEGMPFAPAIDYRDYGKLIEEREALQAGRELKEKIYNVKPGWRLPKPKTSSCVSLVQVELVNNAETTVSIPEVVEKLWSVIEDENQAHFNPPSNITETEKKRKPYEAHKIYKKDGQDVNEKEDDSDNSEGSPIIRTPDDEKNDFHQIKVHIEDSEQDIEGDKEVFGEGAQNRSNGLGMKTWMEEGVDLAQKTGFSWSSWLANPPSSITA